MAATRADLIVVGAGLAGSAAAWAAAERGMDVVVLEAFQPGHRNGSSHGSARIFRRAYPDPLYVRLTGQAGRLWRLLEAEAGESLLQQTGGLDFGARRDPEQLHAVLTELRRARRAAGTRGGRRTLAVRRLHRRRPGHVPRRSRRARPRPRDGRDAPAGRRARRRRQVRDAGDAPRSGAGRRRRGRAHRQRRVRRAGRGGRGRRLAAAADRRPGAAAAADGDPAAGLPLRAAADGHAAVADRHLPARGGQLLRPARRPGRRAARRDQAGQR